MEENLVVTNAAGSEMQPPVADGQAGAGEEISAADILAESTEQTAETVNTAPPVATEEPVQADAAPQKTYTQSEFDDAVRQRAGHIQRGMEQKLHQDPYYLAGKRLAEMQAMSDGVTPEIAVQRVLNEGFERQAQALAADPQALARAVLGNRIGMNPPPIIQPLADERSAIASNIAAGLRECAERGELPRDFDLNKTVERYPDFLEDCTQYGVRAALNTVRKLDAMNASQQQTLQQAAVNNALPKPIRPGANTQEDGPIDYTKLSQKDWQRMNQRFREESLKGRAVRI